MEPFAASAVDAVTKPDNVKTSISREAILARNLRMPMAPLIFDEP
jgi:hypothetical protein